MGWTSGGNDTNNIRCTRRSKRKSGCYDQQVIGIGHQTLFYGNFTRTAKHVAEIVSVVRIWSRELWIDTPAQGELTSSFLQGTDSQNAESNAKSHDSVRDL